MLRRTVESFANGYVNTREATNLAPGEISEGLNMTYRPFSSGLRQAFPLTSPGTLVNASNDVVGLKVLQFSDETEFLFCQNGTNYYASAGLAGAFATVGGSITASTAVDVATYDNRHYVFNGTHANQTLYLNGSTKTLRAHGLTAVSVPPSAAIVAGNWNLETGVYEYWYTEVVTFTEGSSTYSLESDFVGEPAVVTIGDTTSAVLISLPTALANASASKWRIYRAGPRVADGVSLYPVGFLIAELATTIPAFTDGAVTDSGYKRPATVATTGGSWSTTTGITAGTQGDNTPATYTSASASTLTAYGYSFTSSDPIAGIAIFIRAKITGASAIGVNAITVAISGDSGATYSDERGIPMGLSNAYLGAAGSSLCVVGGNTDLWGADAGFITAAMLNGANTFRVRVNVPVLTGLTFGTISIDDIDVKAFYGGSVSEPIGTFPYFSLSVDGAASAGSMLGVPPVSSTGAVFEDSLVVNDVNEPGLIRYSPAGLPEYFPSVYYMRLDVGKAEKITAIRAIGGRLVITTASAVYRVNYLPRTFDASFDRGRPIELIAYDTGISNPQNISRFTSPSTGRPMLAAMTTRGLMATDGFDIQPVLADWLPGANGIQMETITEATLSDIQVSNNGPLSTLNIVYSSGAFRIECCYHPSHLKAGGMMKVSTPIRLYNSSNTAYTASSSASSRGGVLYVGTDSTSANEPGRVLKCDSTSDSALPAWSGTYAITRRFFPAGVGNEVRVNSIFLIDTSFAVFNTITVTMTPIGSTSNHADFNGTAATAAKAASATETCLKFEAHMGCEGLRVRFDPDASVPALGWGDITVEFEHFGHVEQGT